MSMYFSRISSAGGGALSHRDEAFKIKDRLGFSDGF